MKLDNRGFAITGILYTIFILFLISILSLLSGLRNKRLISERYLNLIENKYKGELINIDNLPNIIEKTGKYEFILEKNDIENNFDIICITYLKNNTQINSYNDLTFIPETCNNYKSKIKFNKKYYSFEEKWYE